ncbi:unspecific monooxygenase [Allocatelliglobosispora scoriae]|uniref:Unspecific monooxygenase n=1 Tax=Allocatelliglobosispora scoriae TaxID=643052 RepID=A0A841BJD9_9ACTN|nr:flavin reductase family protein [Allocatelliglobosispora scoriae]MBB5868374.1 unspecific monooxygenase [Allocatelliglobosispora scoriae]
MTSIAQAPMPGDAQARTSLRHTLSSYATGVAVVTTVDTGGEPVGLTVNSFTSVSLDPPLVLWCLNRDSASYPAFLAAGGYAVNVLRSSQEGVARRFAGSRPDRFAGLAWRLGHAGQPVLGGALAHLVCRTHRRLTLGDHLVLVGEVIAHGAAGGSPLVFHDHRYLTSTPPA